MPLGKNAKASDWVHDFVHSDNPQFKGKSKDERIRMALGAYYSKHANGGDVPHLAAGGMWGAGLFQVPDPTQQSDPNQYSPSNQGAPNPWQQQAAPPQPEPVPLMPAPQRARGGNVENRFAAGGLWGGNALYQNPNGQGGTQAVQPSTRPLAQTAFGNSIYGNQDWPTATNVAKIATPAGATPPPEGGNVSGIYTNPQTGEQHPTDAYGTMYQIGSVPYYPHQVPFGYDPSGQNKYGAFNPGKTYAVGGHSPVDAGALVRALDQTLGPYGNGQTLEQANQSLPKLGGDYSPLFGGAGWQLPGEVFDPSGQGHAVHPAAGTVWHANTGLLAGLQANNIPGYSPVSGDYNPADDPTLDMYGAPKYHASNSQWRNVLEDMYTGAGPALGAQPGWTPSPDYHLGDFMKPGFNPATGAMPAEIIPPPVPGAAAPGAGTTPTPFMTGMGPPRAEGGHIPRTQANTATGGASPYDPGDQATFVPLLPGIGHNSRGGNVGDDGGYLPHYDGGGDLAGLNNTVIAGLENTPHYDGEGGGDGGGGDDGGGGGTGGGAGGDDGGSGSGNSGGGPDGGGEAGGGQGGQGGQGGDDGGQGNDGGQGEGEGEGPGGGPSEGGGPEGGGPEGGGPEGGGPEGAGPDAAGPDTAAAAGLAAANAGFDAADALSGLSSGPDAATAANAANAATGAAGANAAAGTAGTGGLGAAATGAAGANAGYAADAEADAPAAAPASVADTISAAISAALGVTSAHAAENADPNANPDAPAVTDAPVDPADIAAVDKGDPIALSPVDVSPIDVTVAPVGPNDISGGPAAGSPGSGAAGAGTGGGNAGSGQGTGGGQSGGPGGGSGTGAGTGGLGAGSDSGGPSGGPSGNGGGSGGVGGLGAVADARSLIGPPTVQPGEIGTFGPAPGPGIVGGPPGPPGPGGRGNPGFGPIDLLGPPADMTNPPPPPAVPNRGPSEAPEDQGRFGALSVPGLLGLLSGLSPVGTANAQTGRGAPSDLPGGSFSSALDAATTSTQSKDAPGPTTQAAIDRAFAALARGIQNSAPGRGDLGRGPGLGRDDFNAVFGTPSPNQTVEQGFADLAGKGGPPNANFDIAFNPNTFAMTRGAGLDTLTGLDRSITAPFSLAGAPSAAPGAIAGVPGAPGPMFGGSPGAGLSSTGAPSGAFDAAAAPGTVSADARSAATEALAAGLATQGGFYGSNPNTGFDAPNPGNLGASPFGPSNAFADPALSQTELGDKAAQAPAQAPASIDLDDLPAPTLTPGMFDPTPIEQTAPADFDPTQAPDQTPAPAPAPAPSPFNAPAPFGFDPDTTPAPSTPAPTAFTDEEQGRGRGLDLTNLAVEFADKDLGILGSPMFSSLDGQSNRLISAVLNLAAALKATSEQKDKPPMARGGSVPRFADGGSSISTNSLLDILSSLGIDFTGLGNFGNFGNLGASTTTGPAFGSLFSGMSPLKATVSAIQAKFLGLDKLLGNQTSTVTPTVTPTDTAVTPDVTPAPDTPENTQDGMLGDHPSTTDVSLDPANTPDAPTQEGMLGDHPSSTFDTPADTPADVQRPTDPNGGLDLWSAPPAPIPDNVNVAPPDAPPDPTEGELTPDQIHQRGGFAPGGYLRGGRIGMRPGARMAGGAHLIHASTPGRTDRIKTSARPGSFVIPADVVSGVGQGNTQAGAKIFGEMIASGPYGTGGSSFPKAGGGKLTKPSISVGKVPQPKGLGAMPKMPKVAAAKTPKGLTGNKLEDLGSGTGMPDQGELDPGMETSVMDSGFAEGGMSQEATPIIVAGGEIILDPEIVAAYGNGDMEAGRKVLADSVGKIRRQVVQNLAKLPGPIV